jgi:nucleotide-binding universal stress UspA family protein
MKSKPKKRNTRSAPTKSHGILYGTDFSENAHEAALATVAIAKQLGESITLLHSVEFPSLSAKSRDKALRWLTTRRRNDLREEAKLLSQDGVDVTTQLATGNPDEALVNFSREKPPRLIVVSSIGRRGLDGWLLGSVAERTAERAPAPTLVIRTSKPWLEWARGERPLKVFVCFNHTRTSEGALRWVNVLSKAGPLDIVVGWMDWPAEEWKRVGSKGPLSLTTNPLDVQCVLERDLNTKAKQILGDTSFRVRIEAGWGRTDDHLVDMAKKERADLLVVGSHQYRGFERLWHTSVSRGLLRRAPMSVAVVPYQSGKHRQITLPPPVQQILVATDFSELANAAIPQAYSLLRGGGAVHLLHVLPQTEDPLPSSEQPIVDCHYNKEELQTIAEYASQLRALVPVEAEALGILTQVQILKRRDIATTICQYADCFGIEMICLGSHGRSGLTAALLGSVAQGVIARTRRPLLLIRHPPD